MVLGSLRAAQGRPRGHSVINIPGVRAEHRWRLYAAFIDRIVKEVLQRSGCLQPAQINISFERYCHFGGAKGGDRLE
jgi:hypothetical protein